MDSDTRNLLKRAQYAYAYGADAYKDLLAKQEEIERLHRRLEAFMGEGYAREMVVAIHRQALDGRASYYGLLRVVVDIVIGVRMPDLREKRK